MTDDSGHSHKASGRKKALIIAVTNYEHYPPVKQLDFVRNDGEQLYSILRSQGYEIPGEFKLIGRVTGNQLRKAIIDFFRKDAAPEDTLLFYFSGHGMPDGWGSHYLVSTDTSPEYPEYAGFPYNDLQSLVDRSPAEKKITILDCCYSGAAKIEGGTKDDITAVTNSAIAALRETFHEGKGKCYFCSSQADQQSFKMKDSEMSVFTHCILEGLRGREVDDGGYVTAKTLEEFVQRQAKKIDRRQEPVIKTVLSGGTIALAFYPELAKKEKSGRGTDQIEHSVSQVDIGLKFLLDTAQGEFAKKEYEKSIVFFDKILEIKPEHRDALNSKGVALYKLKKYIEAKECFKKVLNKEPADMMALSNLDLMDELLAKTSLWEQSERKSHEKGEQTMQSGTQSPTNKDRATEIFNEAMTAYTLGKFDDAYKLFEEVLKIDPKHEGAGSLKDMALDNLRLSETQMEKLTDTEDLQDLLNKSFELINKGMYEESLVCSEKALTLDRNQAAAWNNKGVALDALGRSEEAMECYVRALKNDPTNEVMANNKKVLLQKLTSLEVDSDGPIPGADPRNRYNDPTLPGYKRTLKFRKKRRSDRDLAGTISRAINDFNVEEYETAIILSDEALQMDPFNSEIWNLKAAALHKLGRYSEALICVEKALELDRNDKLATEKERDILDALAGDLHADRKLGPHDEFGGHRDDPPSMTDVEYWFNEGLKYSGTFTDTRLTAPDPRRAIESFDKALKLDPKMGSALKYKAYALNALGRKREAEECLKMARKLGYS